MRAKWLPLLVATSAPPLADAAYNGGGAQGGPRAGLWAAPSSLTSRGRMSKCRATGHMSGGGLDATQFFAGGKTMRTTDGTLANVTCCCLKKHGSALDDCKLAGGAEKCNGATILGSHQKLDGKYHAYYKLQDKNPENDDQGRRCIILESAVQHVGLPNVPQDKHPMVLGVLPQPLQTAASCTVYLVRHGESEWNKVSRESTFDTVMQMKDGLLRDARLTPRGQDQAIASQGFFETELKNVPAENVQLAGSLLSRAYDTLVLATSLVWGQGPSSFRIDQVPAMMEFGGGQDVQRQRTIPGSTDDDLRKENFAPVYLKDSSLWVRDFGHDGDWSGTGNMYSKFYNDEEAPTDWLTTRSFQVQAGYPRRTTSSSGKVAERQVRDVAHYVASQALAGKTHIVIGSHSGLLRRFFQYLKGKGIITGKATLGGESWNHLEDGQFDLTQDGEKGKLPNGALAKLKIAIAGQDLAATSWEPGPKFVVKTTQVLLPDEHFPILGYLEVVVTHFASFLVEAENGPVQVTIESGASLTSTSPQSSQDFALEYRLRIPVTSPNQRVRFRVTQGSNANIKKNTVVGVAQRVLSTFVGDPGVSTNQVEQVLHLQQESSPKPGLNRAKTGVLQLQLKYTTSSVAL